jgi:hypothetical protein
LTAARRRGVAFSSTGPDKLLSNDVGGRAMNTISRLCDSVRLEKTRDVAKMSQTTVRWSPRTSTMVHETWMRRRLSIVAAMIQFTL